MIALDICAAMVLDNGKTIGQVATREQWEVLERCFRPEPPFKQMATAPRGWGKTTLTAAAGCGWLVEAPVGAHGYVFAVSQDQAGLLVDFAEGLIYRTPALRDVLVVQSNRIVHKTTGASVEIRPADGASAHGLLSSFTVVDELAQWPETRKHKKLWESVYSGSDKVPGGRFVAITSAGEPQHISAKILAQAKRSDRWAVLEVPGPLPWISPEQLADQKAMLPESSFRRYHLNEWSSSEDRLTSLEDLRACVLLDGPLEPVAGVQYLIGLDLGLKRDRTCACVCHGERSGDGVRVVLDRIEVWAGSRLRPVDLTGVEQWLLEVALRFNRAKLIVDPYQAVGMAQRLRRGGLRVEEYVFSQQSVGRLAVALHTAIRDHRLVLPDDEGLIDELANVRLRETSPGVLRMDHDSDRHDDRAIALSLAVQHLATAGAGGQVYLEYLRGEVAKMAERPARTDPRLLGMPRFERVTDRAECSCGPGVRRYFGSPPICVNCQGQPPGPHDHE